MKDNHRSPIVTDILSKEGTILDEFMNDIGHYDLLKIDEEIEFARRVIKARHSKDISVINKGIEARDKLILSNLRLVVSIAKQYTYTGVSFMDLILDGTVGLMNAVDRFEVNKEYRLSTYATYWIKQSIKRSIANTSKTIRLPEYIYDLISKVRKAKREYYYEHGVYPNDVAISQETGISLDMLRLMDIYDDDTISLDTIIGENERTIMDIINDNNNLNPEEFNQLEIIEEYVLDSLALLGNRERLIIQMRYGIQSDVKTLEEIGLLLNITRERVRQIEKQAIKKLQKIMKF